MCSVAIVTKSLIDKNKLLCDAKLSLGCQDLPTAEIQKGQHSAMPPILAEIIMLSLLGGVSYLISGWAYRQELDRLRERTTLLKLLMDQKLEEANEASDGR